jgi:hypothetical protein
VSGHRLAILVEVLRVQQLDRGRFGLFSWAGNPGSEGRGGRDLLQCRNGPKGELVMPNAGSVVAQKRIGEVGKSPALSWQRWDVDASSARMC